MKRVVHVKTPISLDRLRKLREAGFLPVIVFDTQDRDEQSVQLLRMYRYRLARYERTLRFFLDTPSYELGVQVERDFRQLRKAHKLLSSVAA